MQKTTFIKGYLTTKTLIKLAIPLLFLGFISKLLATLFELSLLKFPNFLSTYTNLAYNISLAGLFSLTVLMFATYLYLILDKSKNDRVRNFKSSMGETRELHRFLKHNETDLVAPVTLAQTKTSNKVTREFNHFAKRSVIDVQNDIVLVYIEIPRSQQAQKMLHDMDAQLKEQLSNRIPDYYFSNGNRQQNALFIEGKRR